MQNFKLRDVITIKTPIAISNTATVAELLKVLERNEVSLAPVVASDGTVLGIVDTLDILAFLLQVSEQSIHPVGHVTTSNSLSTDDFVKLTERNEHFTYENVAKVIDLSKRNLFIPLNQNDTLQAAVELFAKGIHRIPVIDSSGKLLSIFTQSQFAQFLFAHPELLGAARNTPILDLPELGTSEGKNDEIVKVDKNVSALEAFKTIFSKKLSAVVIGDEDGIQSQLSASDLRSLSTEPTAPLGLKSLLMPVKDFIDRVREHAGQHKTLLVWCMPGVTIETVVKMITESKVHRVYVLDNYTGVYGIISITDIAKFLLTNK